MRLSRVSRLTVALLVCAVAMTACNDSAPAAPTSTTAAASTSTISGTTAPEPASSVVLVAFATGDGTDCGEVTTFERELEPGFDPIARAFELLVAGPTVEEMAAGAGSVFSDESSGALRSVILYDDLLVVDLRDVRALLSNASTSCGSQSLLAQLNTAAFQFPEVMRARYEIDGSCDIFGEWLQGECSEYTRQGAVPAPLTTNERALGSGCVPGTDGLPDGRWFGYVTDATAQQLTFDLACWFSGSAAAVAAAEDGEESPPPNDYYVRNQNTLLRTVAVAPGTVVAWLPSGDPADSATIGFDRWVRDRSGRSYLPGVWLQVVDGVVVLIDEQYVP